MKQDKLNKIIEDHQHWLSQNCEGWEEMRADLSRANLSRADLSRADLSRADLSGADLSGADLSRANLSGADLSRADLFGADLFGADLSRADLFGANLSGADLSRADLFGANLSGAKNIPLIPYACPDFGIFIGWKKAFATERAIDVIVQLEIPEDAKRLSGSGRKCRCDKAKVLSIKDKDGTEYEEAYSGYKSDFIYRVGETVVVEDFDENRWNECSTGIHFFINRQEAAQYR